MRFLRIMFPALILPLLLTGCGKKELPPAPPAQERQNPRPAAALGTYVSYFLGKGAYPSVGSAMKGIEAQVRFLQAYNPLTSDDTFTLLQEFGNVLQVDVTDLLNRSTDRPHTLTAYTDGLRNITERAENMVKELENRAADLRTQGRDAHSQVSALQRSVDQAYRTQDYSTAGGLQQQLADAQTRVSQLTTEDTQVRNVENTYKRLIDVAQKRLNAIEENREVLIAGLTVVQLPGIEDIGVLETQKGYHSQGEGSPLLKGLDNL